jgi:pilus assembly protein Flp/PilA
MRRSPSLFPVARFLADERGATAIEYGLICAMIAVVVIGIASTGGALDLLYQKMTAIVDALAGGGGGDDGGG